MASSFACPALTSAPQDAGSGGREKYRSVIIASALHECTGPRKCTWSEIDRLEMGCMADDDASPAEPNV